MHSADFLRVLRVLAAIWGVIVPASAQEGAGTGTANGELYFDIPQLPFAEALEAFSAASGVQILMAVDPGPIRSQPIKGLYRPAEALRLISGNSGLKVYFTASMSAVVEKASPQEGSGVGSSDAMRHDAVLQRDVLRALCHDDLTRPGGYRAAIDLWIGPNGRVKRAVLLGSTENSERDRRLVASLEGVVTAPPAVGLPQPTTLLLLPQANHGCDPDASDRARLP